MFQRLITSATTVLLLGSAAHPSTIAFEASASFPSELSGYGIANFDVVTGSFTFDPLAPPLVGPTTIDNGVQNYIYSYQPYVDYTLRLGALELHGSPSTSTSAFDDSISFENARNAETLDIINVSSATNQTIDGNLYLDNMDIYAAGSFDTYNDDLADGIGFLTADLMRELGETLSGGVISFRDGSNEYVVRLGPLTFSEVSDVSTVPLPAALPLFLTAICSLGLLGWRRKEMSSVAVFRLLAARLAAV